MIPQKFCLSGHSVAVWDFGRDASKDDGMNQYCKPCQRNRTKNRRAEMAAQGISHDGHFATRRAVHDPEVLSEQFIQREEEKRAEELEIQRQLEVSEEKDRWQKPELTIADVSYFGPSSEKRERAWRAG